MSEPRTTPEEPIDPVEANPEDHPADAPTDEATSSTMPEPDVESVDAAGGDVPPASEAVAADDPIEVLTPATRAPLPYAVIHTGGKQYRVSVGDRISVERLAADAGTEITIDRVLLIGGDGTTRVGTPIVEGAAVTASVEDHFRGEKLVVFKYKPKKRYRRRIGHRQSQTKLTITGIVG